MTPPQASPSPAPRPIICHGINHRRPHPQPFAALADFGLVFERVVQPDAEAGCPLVYCAEFATERAVYTVIDPGDIAATFTAPFLYTAQLARAQKVLTVPFERVSELAATTGLRPTFVFSPGRAGSTLLARLLHAIGRLSASEPDIFSQFAILPPMQRARLHAETERHIIVGAVGSLARYAGSDVVIKLRSQCSAIADTIIAALPDARAAFLFRDRQDWAISRHRAFTREKPAGIANSLHAAVLAFDRLTKCGVVPTVLWYEDLVAHPAESLIKLLSHSPSEPGAIAGGIAKTMASDSQAGTTVARAELADRQVDPDFITEFNREWHAIAPNELLERHGLTRLG